jgi:hypothetical protein
MDDWFVRPETRRLALSDDHWILVKRRLNAGEYRAHLQRSSSVGDDDRRHLNSLDHGLSLVVAYVLDWSLTSGEQTIRGMADADRSAVYDSLDQDRFTEIFQAVEAHVAAMELERSQLKNARPDGEKTSEATSPSPSDVVGVLIGSGT